MPPNKHNARKDLGDLVYLTVVEKYKAIAEDVLDCRRRGQPVLVGTTSIENSEVLSELLRKQGIPHQVLNAKHHEQEAHIIAQAGKPGAVTIATNMAGRGTDIVLGGSLEEDLAGVDPADTGTVAALRAEWQARHASVVASGGLHVIGSERHESRRVDNQLRGRSGRQGDPGSTRFYLSLEDPLMRIFASDRIAPLMARLGMQNGESIEHPWVTRAIENAQRKVEARNFDIRKQLLEYDDVANDQRRVIYQMRDELMEAEDIAEMFTKMRADAMRLLFDRYVPPNTLEEQWDIKGLEESVDVEFDLRPPVSQWLEEDYRLDEQGLLAKITDLLEATYQAKVDHMGASVLRLFEKSVMLQVLDNSWKEHLAAMDHLRQGIHLRGYAQKDPKQEYKREAFEMFTSMLDAIKHEVISISSRVRVQSEEDVRIMDEQNHAPQAVQYQHAEATAMNEPVETGEPDESGEADVSRTTTPFVREQSKVGRNDPCPCGSGQKYKQCHGKLS